MTRYLFYAALIFIAGCNDPEPVVMKPVDTEAIFFDYRITGNEETGEATVRLQFFEGDENGRTIRMMAPGKVELDGVSLKSDSSKMNGFYYESRFAADDFAGKHVIGFRKGEEELHQTEFNFQPISLTSEPPVQLDGREQWIHLEGVEPGNTVRMLLIDTAFYSRGVDKVDTVKGDSVSLTPRDFENLRNGPIYLEIFHEKETPIQDSTRKLNGRLSMTYMLKRTFQLKEHP